MHTEKKQIQLLGIEASGITSGIYLSRDDALLAQTTLNIRNIHSRSMTVMLQMLLEQSGTRITDLNGVVLSSGPGSFTGLRIGYSLGKGLAHALHLPMIEVPTLDIWAYQQGRTDLPVASVMDAHRNEVYIAIYRWEDEVLIKTKDYRLLPLDELGEYLGGRTLITGSDLEKLKPDIEKNAGDLAVFPFPMMKQPEGWALLKLGFEKYSRRETSNPESCEPLYIRAFRGVM